MGRDTQELLFDNVSDFEFNVEWTARVSDMAWIRVRVWVTP